MKRFCLRGHDTSLVGRTSQNACKACKAIYNAEHKPTRETRNVYLRKYRRAGRERDRELLVKVAAAAIQYQLSVRPDDYRAAALAALLTLPAKMGLAAHAP